MKELLDFEEHERYIRENERFEHRESIHKEAHSRKRKQAEWNKFKTRILGRKPIG